MAYLEDRKLVHRDLAARNVLVNDDGTAKVGNSTAKISNSTLPDKYNYITVLPREVTLLR